MQGQGSQVGEGGRQDEGGEGNDKVEAWEEEYQGNNVHIVIHRKEHCQKGCIKVQVERDEYADNDQTSANKNHKINAGFNWEEREVSLRIIDINCHW